MADSIIEQQSGKQQDLNGLEKQALDEMIAEHDRQSALWDRVMENKSLLFRYVRTVVLMISWEKSDFDTTSEVYPMSPSMLEKLGL
jgi:hypothetical protein